MRERHRLFLRANILLAGGAVRQRQIRERYRLFTTTRLRAFAPAHLALLTADETQRNEILLFQVCIYCLLPLPGMYIVYCLFRVYILVIASSGYIYCLLPLPGAAAPRAQQATASRYTSLLARVRAVAGRLVSDTGACRHQPLLTRDKPLLVVTEMGVRRSAAATARGPSTSMSSPARNDAMGRVEEEEEEMRFCSRRVGERACPPSSREIWRLNSRNAAIKSRQ
jgi:hypothetical protein